MPVNDHVFQYDKKHAVEIMKLLNKQVACILYTIYFALMLLHWPLHVEIDLINLSAAYLVQS